MKKIIYILIAVLAITFGSCTPDEVTVNTLAASEAELVGAELNAPAVSLFEIIQTTDGVDGNETTEAVNFTWSAAAGDNNGAIMYYIQLDIADNEFATAVTIPLAQEGTSELSRALTFGELNDALNKLSKNLKAISSPISINFGAENNLNVRVESILGATIAKGYSQPITIAVIPYFTGLSNELFVSGAALTNNVSLTVTDGIFEGRLKLTNGTFRFFAEPAETNISYNYEYFESNGYTIDPLLENANDDEMNFNFIGTEGDWNLVLDTTSKTITLTEILVTPPEGLFLVGDAVASGWDPNNNNTPLFKDPSQPGVFNYTGFFKAGGEGFKFLEIGDWHPQWGKGASDGELAGSPATQEGDPSAIAVPTDGYYTLQVDFNTLSYTFEPFDASSATIFTTIGVIGDATNKADLDNDGTPDGWQSDMDMTQSTFDSHIWYINGITLEDGEIKFRANNDWNDNWGDNGGNISVSAGTYDIWLNDITGEYLLILKEDLVSVPVNLFLVGDAVASGWDPNNTNTPLFKNPSQQGIFNYTGFFKAGGEGFKFLEIGDWQPQWGKGASDGVLAGNPATQEGDPSAIAVPTDGYYTLQVDFNTLSYTFEPFDESSATIFTTIGVIGDATNKADLDNDGTPDGWQSDKDMTQSAFDDHIWYINGITLEDGEIKFRADNDWNDQWGDNGGNISVSAGTYNIWLNDITGEYILIPII